MHIYDVNLNVHGVNDEVHCAVMVMVELTNDVDAVVVVAVAVKGDDLHSFVVVVVVAAAAAVVVVAVVKNLNKVVQ